MNIEKILFMRKTNSRKQRGFKVWNHYPVTMFCTLDQFILVLFDMDTIGLTKIEDHNTIQLDLDSLMAQYPPEPGQRVLEDGTTETFTIPGYFDEECVSSHVNPPLITIDDVTWEGK